MKRMLLALVMAVFSVGAFAQFEEGTKYISTSLTGLDLSYSKNDKFSLGLKSTGGYFLLDELMLTGSVELGYNGRSEATVLGLGAGGRYYIRQNGLYLGAGAKFEFNHTKAEDYSNLYLTPEVGYCFYLNHYLSVEPAVYYDLSLNHFSDYSKVGLRVGFGYYF